MQAQAFISHYEFFYDRRAEFPAPTEEKKLQLQSGMVTGLACPYKN